MITLEGQGPVRETPSVAYSRDAQKALPRRLEKGNRGCNVVSTPSAGRDVPTSSPCPEHSGHFSRVVPVSDSSSHAIG